jgi:hypothetical protein
MEETALPASVDLPRLSGADADAGLMRAGEVHRVQDLNVRDTGDGSSEGIHDHLRTVEIDDSAVARIHCDHLVLGDVAADEHR